MRKIIIALLLVLSVYGTANAQFSTAVGAWRVVFVSPNYPNIYPRYTKLEYVWNAIKDSASVSTGKYFIINAVTAYNNISDWTSGYKDSIVSRDPYMKVTAFGQSVNDSIVGVTTEEFSLVAGILSLNGLIAGDGLSFASHELKVNVKNPILMSNDTVYFRYDATNFTLVGGTFTWYKTTNSGIQSTASGFQVLPRQPLRTSGDTVLLPLAPEFSSSTDSLRLNYDADAFYTTPLTSPSFHLKIDSGLVVPVSGNGVKVMPDWATIVFNSSKKLTVNTAIWGDGLAVYSNVAQVNVLYPIKIENDTVKLDYLPQHFGLLGGTQLYLKVDSGLVANTFPVPSIPKVSLDWITMTFTTAGALQVNPLIAGSGLLMTSGIINIVPNEFAKIENDTLKIKTSTLLCFRFDSLTSNTAYDINADTIGYGMSASGKVKRVSVSYKTDAGNDTVLTLSYDKSFVSKDRISAINYLAGTGLEIFKNGASLLTISLPDFTEPYKRRINVVVEIYQEAQ